jgi:hypothetical protein
MDYNTDIPEEIYKYLLPFLVATYRISSADPKKPSLHGLLERSYLQKWIGERRVLFIPALRWALEHPDRDYQVFLPEGARERFSNEDCVKLLALFLRSLEHLYDEGPDIVEPVKFYVNTPGDMDD